MALALSLALMLLTLLWAILTLSRLWRALLELQTKLSTLLQSEEAGISKPE
jgi:hypothetical protein